MSQQANDPNPAAAGTMQPPGKGAIAPDRMNSVVDDYARIHDAATDDRKAQYEKLVNDYYDLSTQFYEFGWGPSFHFAPRRKGESLKDSIVRHEHFLADRLALKPDMHVLDIGCGIGGPTRNLTRYTGARFTGLNNNAYQVKRARELSRELQSRCDFVVGDFMQLSASPTQYDAAIAIESLPHAPDKTAAFREIFQILRPGAGFAGYDWCLTDRYDPSNPEHQEIKSKIMIGNGLPDIATETEVVTALREAGFDLLEARDLAGESDPSTPWYRPLQSGDFRLSSLTRSPLGRAITNVVLGVGEKLRLVPKGAKAVSTFLNAGADALVKGGETGVFTALYFFQARKPLDS